LYAVGKDSMETEPVTQVGLLTAAPRDKWFNVSSAVVAFIINSLVVMTLIVTLNSGLQQIELLVCCQRREPGDRQISPVRCLLGRRL
jgi:hypothetical protein